MKELTLDAQIDNLPSVLAFVDEIMEEHEVGMKTMMQIDIAVEELFVNIASYAYAPDSGKATVRVETEDNPNRIKITFIDTGTPYNPLEKEDPDITLSAEERQTGGLGIFMVKKSMDDMAYEYCEGANILTVSKLI